MQLVMKAYTKYYQKYTSIKYPRHVCHSSRSFQCVFFQVDNSWLAEEGPFYHNVYYERRQRNSFHTLDNILPKQLILPGSKKQKKRLGKHRWLPTEHFMLFSLSYFLSLSYSLSLSNLFFLFASFPWYIWRTTDLFMALKIWHLLLFKSVASVDFSLTERS